LPIRRCCAGDGRVISSRTFVMCKDPQRAVKLGRISVHAIRIALKTNAAERRCPFSGKTTSDTNAGPRSTGAGAWKKSGSSNEHENASGNNTAAVYMGRPGNAPVRSFEARRC
jgi:hypothetical protein